MLFVAVLQRQNSNSVAALVVRASSSISRHLELAYHQQGTRLNMILLLAIKFCSMTCKIN